MSSQESKLKIYLLMASHVLIASGGFIFVKLALSEFSAFALGFWRLLFGLLFLLAYSTATNSWTKVEKKDWPIFAFLAFLAVPINQIGYIYGMKYTVPSHASLLYGSTAVVAISLATFLRIEKLRPSRVVAIVLAVSGVTIVVSGHRTQISGSENFFGDLLVSAGVIAWASYTVLGKPMVLKYGATRATTTCLILGSLMGLPFLIWPAVAQDYTLVTVKGWFGAVYAGVLLTGVAYAVWFTLLKKIDPSQVAIVTSPQPVVTTALSTVILGEVIQPTLVIGGVLVLCGLLVMNAPHLYQKFFTERRPPYEAQK